MSVQQFLTRHPSTQALAIIDTTKFEMVTGIETAGLVLGAFPIFVQVLGVYLDAKGNYRSRKALVRELKVEAICFKNTCATLLEGLVPAEVVTRLMSGNGWGDQELHKLLNDRMGVDATVAFVESVEALYLSLENLGRKLGLDENMKVQPYWRFRWPQANL